MKPSLEFLSNYNTSLYHFVEKLTLWDVNVSPTFKKYLYEHFDINAEEEIILEKLSQQRSKLGWDEEIVLHSWAYQGFSNQEKYADIYKAVKWFETKTDKNGETFSDKVNKFQPLLNEKVIQLQKRWEALNLQTEFEEMQRLIDFRHPAASLPAFVVPSPNPNSLQGGANGEGITVEVYPSSDDINTSFSLIVHEFAHKAINPSHYFENLVDTDSKEFFQRKEEDISSNKFADHVEELIIRSFVDVRHFDADPVKKADNYRGRNTVRTDIYALSWEHVSPISPLINNYLDGKLSVEETRATLIEVFKKEVLSMRLVSDVNA